MEVVLCPLFKPSFSMRLPSGKPLRRSRKIWATPLSLNHPLAKSRAQTKKAISSVIEVTFLYMLSGSNYFGACALLEFEDSSLPEIKGSGSLIIELKLRKCFYFSRESTLEWPLNSMLVPSWLFV